MFGHFPVDQPKESMHFTSCCDERLKNMVYFEYDDCRVCSRTTMYMLHTTPVTSCCSICWHLYFMCSKLFITDTPGIPSPKATVTGHHCDICRVKLIFVAIYKRWLVDPDSESICQNCLESFQCLNNE